MRKFTQSEARSRRIQRAGCAACSPRVQGGSAVKIVYKGSSLLELELELIQSHMAQKPMLRGEVGAFTFLRFKIVATTAGGPAYTP